MRRWATAAILASLLFLSGPGEGLMMESSEYRDGYCKGFMDAMGMIQRNRSHYRALLSQPERSQADVLRWIYSRPWRDSVTHRTAPRRLSQPPGEPEIGPPAIESVDLYLVPAISECRVNDSGGIEFKTIEY